MVLTSDSIGKRVWTIFPRLLRIGVYYMGVARWILGVVNPNLKTEKISKLKTGKYEYNTHIVLTQAVLALSSPKQWRWLHIQNLHRMYRDPNHNSWLRP